MSSSRSSRTKPGEDSDDDSLHRLDMSSFKKRNSAILHDLEAQEQERNSLWAALQRAREDGERLRQEEMSIPNEEEKLLPPEPSASEERAPTSAELMAMLSPDALKATEKLPPTPSRFATRRPQRRSTAPQPSAEKKDDNPAILASGFICPTCWMRAPSAEVLRRHDEEVHQTPWERASNRVLDNSGPLGTMTRVAYRKIRRSLSVRPQSTTAADRPDDQTLLSQTRQATFKPASNRPTGRRYSLPPVPPTTKEEEEEETADKLPVANRRPMAAAPARHQSRWKRSQLV